MSICVIVCGSRFTSGNSSINHIRNTLKMLQYHHGYHDIEIVEGGAKGVDTIAKEICLELGYKLKEFKIAPDGPTGWNTLGKAAGPMRNKRMLDYLISQRQNDPGLVLAVIAFHSNLSQSKGTLNMINQVKYHNSKHSDNIGICILNES